MPCQPWTASLNLHFPQDATIGTAQEHHCKHRQLSVNQGASYSHPNDIPTQHQLAPSARQQNSHFHPTWRGSSDRWQDLPPASQLIFTQSACFNKTSQCCSTRQLAITLYQVSHTCRRIFPAGREMPCSPATGRNRIVLWDQSQNVPRSSWRASSPPPPHSPMLKDCCKLSMVQMGNNAAMVL